ncbi:MAG: hypothetical protein DRG78_20380 [Epsilonproteobacteria bacterium]|nr:MAG: hypothetical protein DRG78_20380 [Campylobacterota bacterium]
MRKTLLLALTSSLLLGEVEISGHFDITSQFYLTKPDSKHQNSFTAKQILELKYEKDEITAFVKLYAQEAYYDLKGSSEQTKRSFARIDEAYLKYDRDNDAFEIGKSIKFWGALELRNIVDGFNPNELRDDLFITNKLGVWNSSYTYFTDNGEFSVILKLFEQDQKMAESPYVYYIFPDAVNYNHNLSTSKGELRPSIYLTYSGSTDTQYPIDYAFIYENGYDSQRYFSQVVNNPYSYVQNAYLVEKFMTYNTMVIDATLIKLEALYAVVKDDLYVGDYSHVALGLEHTLEDIYDGSSLGLISEYYRYDTYEDNKYTDLQLFETMQNDLFIGARYSFNNTNSSSIIGGVVYDLEYIEQTYYAKYESQIADNFKLEVDYYFIEPSKKEKTAFSLLGQHQRVGVNVAYYF